jgi:hypothetical protein
VGLQDALSRAIRHPLEGVLVVRPVGLQDQIAPAEVRDDPAAREVQRRIDKGVSEAASQDEIEHRVLELALRGRRAGGDHVRERLAATLRARPVEDRHERAE